MIKYEVEQTPQTRREAQPEQGQALSFIAFCGSGTCGASGKVASDNATGACRRESNIRPFLYWRKLNVAIASIPGLQRRGDRREGQRLQQVLQVTGRVGGERSPGEQPWI